jgi:hypothetical protein
MTSDLSKERLAQIAIAVRKSSRPKKGPYTQLVERIDRRLANIERLLTQALKQEPKA